MLFMTKKIAIAGALGFVGKHLIEHFCQNPDFEIYALSRSFIEDKDQLPDWSLIDKKNKERIHIVQCDLFSLLDCEKALEGMDFAFYLVHSMLPTSKLMQADFSDMDLILSDNFARAAKKNQLKHLIYLGGIIPKLDKLSPHLESRLETEETLMAYGTPVTSLRAAIVLGQGGSSFNIIIKLVERLPAMICPHWCATKSNPIWVGDVVKAFDYVLNKKEYFNNYYDLSGATCLSYRDIMKETAQYLGLKRYFLNFPFFTPGLSKLWVSVITGTPKNLVYPLITSLKHEMIPNSLHQLVIPNHTPLNYKESLARSLKIESLKVKRKKLKFWGLNLKKRDVRSIQRLAHPKGKNAKWVAQKYLEWLPHFFSLIKLIKIKIDGPFSRFFIPLCPWPILELTFSEERSTPDRQLFYITGGFLAKKNQGRGRLEFRETANGKYFLVAIHEFIPSLPWFIYIYTQAPFHLFVMKRFQAYMKGLEN